MTQETFQKAKQLEDRLKHIGILIATLEEHSKGYALDPPTRMTTYKISRCSNTSVDLYEAEVLCLKRALEAERERLECEFGRL